MTSTASLHYQDVSNPNPDGTYNFLPVHGMKGGLTNGPTGPAHNRNIPTAATTHPGLDTSNHVLFDAALDIRSLNIRGVAIIPTALTNGDAYIAVVNAPDAATAKTWLEDVGSATQDVIYEMGYYGEVLNITRTSPITRVDVLPLNDIMRFVIGAV